MRRNKGITLIALVVTIIVLLILAAVSIATLTGENGILTQASRAKEKTEQAREKEQIELAYTAIKSKKMEIGDNTKISAKDLNDEFDNDGVEAQATDAEEGKIKVTFSKTGHEYIVDQEENIYGPSNVEDTKGPEVKIEVGKITAKSIEIKVKATDESGIGNYKYYLGGQLVEETNNDSYKYTELEEITNYNIEVKVTDKRGNVGETSTTAKTIYSLTTGKTLEKVSENIKMSDENENILTLPAGFKIAGDSATDVTGGVVIEDATYANTKGSQFVWIPVGTVTDGKKTVEINIGRYDFDSSTGKESPYKGDDYKEENLEVGVSTLRK